jgi:RNA polymerase sigma factor (sigma-70 family)
MSQPPANMLALLQACAAGEGEARRHFQDEYGEDIYNFPVKIYGLPLEEAGDFYVYAFENDRIFSRARTFAGRNSIQFRTFLSYYVLKHLFLEWRRTRKELETVSLQAPAGSSIEDERVLEDLLPDTIALETEEVGATAPGPTTEVWSSLSPEERLDLKLLSLLECDLEPEDLLLLARTSGRSITDTLALLAGVQDELQRRDEKLSRLRNELDAVWGWILLRQREVQEIDEKIHLMKTQEGGLGQEKLLSRKRELEHLLAKRYRQREKLVEELRTYKLTTPYKDIARLLNLTVGTVCSRIFRLRERLMREFGEQWAGEERLR